MGKRELVALLSLSSWCLVIVVWLFLAVPWVCFRFVIVVYPGNWRFAGGPIARDGMLARYSCKLVMTK